MSRTGSRVILLVEDNELIRTLLKLFLTGVKCTFWEERDGMGALHLARQIFPDMIITDLDMPRMDGIQLTEALRRESDERLRTVPVIVLTGTNSEAQDKAYKAGANVVLEKPVPRKQLLTAVDRFLPK